MTKVNSLQVVSSTVDSSPIGGTSPSTAKFITPDTSDNSQNAATTAWVAAALAGVQSTNGTLPLPGGLILKWGQGLPTTANGAVLSTNFSPGFPNACLFAMVTGLASGSDYGEMACFSVLGWNTSTVSYYYARNSDHGGMTMTPLFIAIGN